MKIMMIKSLNYDILWHFYGRLHKKWMVSKSNKYPYFCNCCIPSVFLKDRSVKYYHLHIMPKLSVNKKLKRSVDDFETPVRVSKAVGI